LAAAEVAAYCGRTIPPSAPVLLPRPTRGSQVLDEAEAKELLSGFGLRVPASVRADTPQKAVEAARKIGFPVVLKGEGIAHKTEAGAVRVNLGTPAEVTAAAASMPAKSFLVEEMVTDNVAELLVGVTRDPAHGYVLTLAAGGVLTELLDDSQSLLLPVTGADISSAIGKLKLAKIIEGYRGGAPADKSAIVEAVIAVQNFVLDVSPLLEEVEINPLICGRETAVAADALIRMAKEAI
jgi:succinyl-CoA synthetase beta subunit